MKQVNIKKYIYKEAFANLKQTSRIVTKLVLFLFFLCLFSFHLNAETAESQKVSPLLVFHNFGWNMLHMVSYNYGLNFIGSGLATWGLIETGLDWKWRNTVYNNTWLANMGLPLSYAGYPVPVIVPISLYLAGNYRSDRKMQIAGLATAQALMLAQITQISLKMITGRSMPGIFSDLPLAPRHKRDERQEDFSGEFAWFSFDFHEGWPSGHTASAFSAAAVLGEIYYDKPLVKYGAYTWAVLVGVSVTLTGHWVSDTLAGALMGYAAGKVTGKNFSRLLNNDENNETVSFYFSPVSAGILIRI